MLGRAAVALCLVSGLGLVASAAPALATLRMSATVDAPLVVYMHARGHTASLADPTAIPGGTLSLSGRVYTFTDVNYATGAIDSGSQASVLGISICYPETAAGRGSAHYDLSWYDGNPESASPYTHSFPGDLSAATPSQSGTNVGYTPYGKAGAASGAELNCPENVAEPTYGKTVVIRTVSGRVLVKEPGKGRYTPLTGADVVPLGTAIDVGRGRVALTSAKDRSGTTQSAEFYYGAFKVGQTRAGKPLTQLRLIGFDPGECAQGGRAASASSKHAKGLWGDGKGNFQTIGHNGSATVRGTNWFTEDRCQGTLFKVKRGVVAVRDFSRRLDVTLRAGQSYLAPTSK